MKKVRLAFADFYGTPPEDIWEYRILRRFYDVEIDGRDPEYLLDGGLGTDYMRYPKAIRVVRVTGRNDVERAVEEIVALDRDDGSYLAKLAAPKAAHGIDFYEAQLAAFLRNIFDPPIDEARRLNAYGYQTNLRHRALLARKLYRAVHPGKWFKP